MWKQARGPEATYINLIGVFERAGYQDYAYTVNKLFGTCVWVRAYTIEFVHNIISICDRGEDSDNKAYSYIIVWGNYYIICRQKLNQVLDFDNSGASKHLGQIADSMYKWEGPVAEELGLTKADIASIKTKHEHNLKLQT